MPDGVPLAALPLQISSTQRRELQPEAGESCPSHLHSVWRQMQGQATAISPQASFLIRGLRTLAMRMDRHSSAAHAIALTLEAHPAVAWVRYPYLQSHPNYSIARRQMSGGSGMLASACVRAETVPLR